MTFGLNSVVWTSCDIQKSIDSDTAPIGSTTQPGVQQTVSAEVVEPIPPEPKVAHVWLLCIICKLTWSIYKND